ncbi:MAG: DUF1269 domain-containing protein [Desulfobacterales bacterium]|nr:DUF1269 domain-containing protein [Desulfobacterales bacterium]
MSSLVIATFDDPYRAEEMRKYLLEKAREDEITPEEAVVVVVDEKHEVRINHTTHLTPPTALSGGFMGTLAGLLLLNPVTAVIGGITGTAVGAILGALKEAGIDEAFMEGLAAELKPNSSALFVRTKMDDPKEVVGLLEPSAGKVLQTTLEHDDEARLKEALRNVE